MLIRTGCLPLHPPPPTWRALAKPNPKAMLLLKLPILIAYFSPRLYGSHTFEQEIKPLTLNLILAKGADLKKVNIKPETAALLCGDNHGANDRLN